MEQCLALAKRGISHSQDIEVKFASSEIFSLEWPIAVIPRGGRGAGIGINH